MEKEICILETLRNCLPCQRSRGEGTGDGGKINASTVLRDKGIYCLARWLGNSRNLRGGGGGGRRWRPAQGISRAGTGGSAARVWPAEGHNGATNSNRPLR